MSIDGLTAETLAQRFVTLADLEHDVENPPEMPTRARVHTVPGSRVPPGMEEILHEDATTRALDKARELTAYVVQVILAAAGEVLRPSSLAGAQVLAELDDEFLLIAIDDDLEDATRGLRAVVRRYERVIQTGHRCLTLTCPGRYVVPVYGDEMDALVCDGCGDVVGYEVWHKWTPVREWLTPDEAATRLGVSVATVWQRAKRGGWRRRGKGKETRYHVSSIDGSTGRAEASAA